MEYETGHKLDELIEIGTQQIGLLVAIKTNQETIMADFTKLNAAVTTLNTTATAIAAQITAGANDQPQIDAAAAGVTQAQATLAAVLAPAPAPAP